MKCEVVQDLLPLYIEEMVQPATSEMVREHLKECPSCVKVLDELTLGTPKVKYKENPSNAYKKFIQKIKRSTALKVILITIPVALLIYFLIGFLLASSFVFNSFKEADVYTNIAKYTKYVGENAKKPFVGKMIDEDIFPAEITENMNVEDFKMIYYHPAFDQQYFGYLVVNYDEKSYADEVARLENYPSTEYIGNYGVTGFDEDYELLAMEADPTYGFVYALTDGEGKIIYVEMMFFNYYMDLDYTQYIDSEYLPVGFDATEENPYREEMMNNLRN